MDPILYIQGSSSSALTPLFLVHAISGLALPYLSLDSLTPSQNDSDDRLVYGISSPIYSSKNYRLPTSLSDVASQYIDLIKEIQPQGPYLLGGWSLGGIIALKMAEILESRDNEHVLHVVMIDSPNPENYPSFLDRAEHDSVTSMTYKNVANGINAPGIPLDDDGSSSEEDVADYADNDGSSSEEDVADEFSLSTLLPLMRRHIHNGLDILNNTTPSSTKPLSLPVTLIKCDSLARPTPTLHPARKDFLLKTFRDDLMGWQPARFEHFDTVMFGAEHDTAFDKAHVGDLTEILKGVLEGVE